MAADSGGNHESDVSREWLLRCEGFRVDGPEGMIGRVVGPLYEHSVRWDRPSALAVRTPNGVVAVPLDAIESVLPREHRIVVTRSARAFPPAP